MASTPAIIGHRGAPRDHPENTLAAFLRALELGATGVELDVHVTGDGVVVVHHDFAVAAVGTSGERLRIERSPLDDVLAAGTAAGVSIPTLGEVLEMVDGRATVYVELKGAGTDAAVADLLRGRESWTAVHSFDHRAARRARSLLPGLRTGVLLQSYLVDTAAALHAAEATDLWQWYEYVDQQLVDDVHRAGGRVIAWTVNEVSTARALASMGVDGLCTDVPGVLHQAIALGPTGRPVA